AGVMPHCGAHIGQCANRPFRLRPPTCPNGRGALRSPAPTAFQFVKRRVEFAPLATGEETPLQGILKAVVVLPFAASGDFGAGAADIQSIEDGVMPGPILCAFPDHVFQAPPVVRSDRLMPVVEVLENASNAPGGTGIANERQERQGLLDACMGFLL